MLYSNKQIWKVAYPILLSLFAQNLINITDAVFLGRVGEVELGASALAGVYYMAVYMIGFGFSAGSQILMARRNGEGRYDALGAILLQGILFLLLLAFCMFLLTRALSPGILRGIVSSDSVYFATLSYLDWRIFGLFFSFTGVMFRAFFVGITYTRVLMPNALVTALVNVALNYLLIFGKAGFPQMGIAGAAIASVVAEVVSLLYFIVYVFIKVDVLKYGLFPLPAFNFRLIARILNVSVWMMIQYFLTIATWFLFFVAVEHLGERPLAVSNIIRSLSTLIFVLVNAYATTASTLVSNAMGAGRQTDVMPLCRRIVKMCYYLVIPVLVLIAVFPEGVLRIYTDNSELIAGCVPSLFVMLSFYLIAVPGSILFNTVSGTGNTRSALYIESVTLVIYTAAIFYLITYLKLDVALCWSVEHIYWLAMLFFSYLYMKKANWQSKRI